MRRAGFDFRCENLFLHFHSFFFKVSGFSGSVPEKSRKVKKEGASKRTGSKTMNFYLSRALPTVVNSSFRILCPLTSEESRYLRFYTCSFTHFFRTQDDALMNAISVPKSPLIF